MKSVYFMLLNPSKLALYGYPQIFHFSENSVLSTYLDILVGLKSGVWKTASILSSCIARFSIALEAM